MDIIKEMDKNFKKCLDLEKAELHVHLNGLFSSDLIKEILIDEKTQLPQGFDMKKDLNIMDHKKSLIEYLKPWEVLRLMPEKKENLTKLVNKAFENLKENNIKIVELRSSIIYLSFLYKKNLEDTLIMMLNELTNSARIFGVDYGLIITIQRGEYSLVHHNSLIEAYENIGRPKQIIRLDLAGNEDYKISKEIGKSFRTVKDKLGLNITIHAGETGNLQNIIDAVYDFDADRIGHGTAAGKCQETMNLLREKDICIEVCPISNKLTGAIKENETSPFLNFIQNEVPFIICSDNPGIHKASLTDDYVNFLKETGDFSFLENMYARQKQYSFL